MGRIREGWRRLQFLARRNRIGSELEEEMRFHLECRAQEARQAGVDPADADNAARRAFGPALALREAGMEMWGWGWLDRLAQDVRWAVRTLRRSPAFTATALLTIALGVGTNTAIFTVVRAHLLRPLPYPHADRLIWIFETSKSFMSGEPVDATDARVEAWRHARSIDRLATFVGTREILTGGGEAEEIGVGAVSPELFEVLGVSARRGRLFSADENRPGHDAVVVISQALWQRRFGGSDRAIGQAINLESRAYTVIGILPPEFRFAPLDRSRYAWLGARNTDAWVPVSTQFEPGAGQASGRFYLGVVGWLRPGTTAAAAQDELTRLAAASSDGRSGAVVVALQQELTQKLRLPLLLLAGAAGFVLLIVCANVANLQLARGAARGHEMAIRAAVGAGRRRLARQLLVESAVLAFTGGALGLAVVKASLGVLVWLGGRELPQDVPVAVDGWVLGFALAASAGAAVLFGLLPAVQAARVDPHNALKEGGRGPAGRAGRVTGILVVAEIALALMLVAGAGLMVNTVWRLQHVPLGFREDHLLTLQVKFLRALPREGRRRALTTALPRVRALPGVEAAEIANTLPMGGAPTIGGFEIPGAPRAGGHSPTAQMRVVTPGYLSAMGIPLIRGRAFTDADAEGAAVVAIVNETMERKYFGGNALGRQVQKEGGDVAEVVGVVGDIRHETLRSDPVPEIYHPFAQAGAYSTWLAVRTGTEPMATAAAVRSVLREVEPAAVVTDVKTMERRRADALGTSSLLLRLLLLFAGLALLLALVGSYGVVSYWVSRRRQEFGVRLALGAPPGRVIRQVLRETLGLVVVAVALGLAGAAASTRLLSAYLYRVEATDPPTLAVTTVLVIASALAAAYLPARRAANTDPVSVLRE